MRVAQIKDKEVKKYLLENLAGKQLYIPKDRPDSYGKRTKKKAIDILRRARWDDNSICKVMQLYPSWLKKI